MITDMVTMDVTVGSLMDGDRSVVLCTADDFPEFIGCGETEAEATSDLCEKLGAIVWH